MIKDKIGKIKPPEQLLMFPESGNTQKNNPEKIKKEEEKLPDVERWIFDVEDGGAGVDSTANTSFLVYEKGKGFLVVNNDGEEKEIPWNGVKLLLAKHFDYLKKKDKNFELLAEYYEKIGKLEG